MQWLYATIGLVLSLISVLNLFSRIVDLVRWKASGTNHWGLGGFIYIDLIYFGISLLIATSFIAIAIAFQKRKRWGRYLAIAHNTILLVGFFWLLIYLFPKRSSLTPPSQIYIPVSIVILLTAMTVLLLQKETKKVLSG